MSVLATKVARGVSIDVLGVDVSLVLDQCLDHTQVSSQTGDVQRCPKVVRPSVDLGGVFDQDLNQRSMSFTCCQMEWSESI